MLDEAVLKAQDAIEEQLQKEQQPVKVRKLLRKIDNQGKGFKDIDLREAVWLLIGKGKIKFTPNRELALSNTSTPGHK